jgi:hypothetical protein
MAPSNFNHINLSQQAQFGSITTPILADGCVTPEKIGSGAYVVTQDITYTAATGGASGNSITIAYIEDVLPGQEYVTVSGTAITVHIGNPTIVIDEVLDATHLELVSTAGIRVGDTITQGIHSTTVSSVVSATELQVISTTGFVAGNATDNGLLSTAAQILTALQNSYLAGVLVDAVITGTPTNKQVGISSTPLANGQQGTVISGVRADSNPFIYGDLTLVSGTGITLTQVGLDITVSTNGGDLPPLSNGEIWVGNASNVAIEQTVSGDATLANTGTLTLTTVNPNVGSFTNANITVDAKGRITSASNGANLGVRYWQDLFHIGGPGNVFTLTYMPTTNSQIVFWNGLGLAQGVGEDYTLSGTTLTLNVAIVLTAGDKILVIYTY